jgi:gluconokinase
MVIILMGVTGSGKTTVGRLLAKKLGWTFYDADDFHSLANVEKMKSGTPLDDDDRRPWLESLSRLIRDCLRRGEQAILACSALKESYRKFLLIDERVKLIYLKGDYGIIQKRLRERRSHYMNPALLDSQMETLEEPESALEIDISLSPDEIVKRIKTSLGV